MDASDEKGALIICVDFESFFDSIVNTMPNQILVVTDRHGGVVYQSNNDVAIHALLASKQSVRINADDYMVLRHNSQKKHWNYYVLTDKRDFYMDSSDIGMVVVFIILACILVGIF